MPTVTDTNTPTRRNAIRFGGAALAAGITSPALASTSTAPGADAELLATHAAFMASHGRLYPSDGRMTTGMTDAESNVETDRWYAAMDRVAELPASTPEGRRAKIEVAHAALNSTAYSNGNGLEREEQCALDVLASLLGSAA